MPVLESVFFLTLYPQLHLVIVVSDFNECWRYIFNVRSCGGGGANSEVVVF